MTNRDTETCPAHAKIERMVEAIYDAVVGTVGGVPGLHERLREVEQAALESRQRILALEEHNNRVHSAAWRWIISIGPAAVAMGAALAAWLKVSGGHN